MQSRPKFNDEFVSQETAQAIMPYILSWMQRKRPGIDDAEKMTVRDKVTRAVTEQRGQEAIIASLVKEGITPDDEITRLFVNVEGKRKEVHHRLVKLWVRNECIKPAKRRGAEVTFKRDGGTEKGTIIEVDRDTARYTVFCEHLGHKTSGMGVRGLVVNCEDVL